MKEPPFIGAPSLRMVVWSLVAGFAFIVTMEMIAAWT